MRVGLLLNNGTIALFVSLIGRETATLNVARILAAGATWAFKFATMQQWVFPARPEADRRSMAETVPGGEDREPATPGRSAGR